MGSKSDVIVQCMSENSALLFVNTRQIEINSITFQGCNGYYQNSISEEAISKGFPQKIGLFFQNCSDIILHLIEVGNSPQATGVGFYGSTGNITVLNSTFGVNSSTAGYSNGGGMYIESCCPTCFYCSGNSNNSQLSSLNSNPLVMYTLQHCGFYGNRQWDDSTASEHSMESDQFWQYGGGGVTVNIRAGTIRHIVKVSLCRFANNKALGTGGGLRVLIMDKALGNRIVVEDSEFESNQCTQTEEWGGAGGAIYIAHHNIGSSTISGVSGNRVEITNSWFLDNRADNGGGAVSISSSLQKIENDSEDQLLSVIIRDCNFQRNEAKSGAALFVSLSPLIVQGRLPTVEIYNTNFSDNKINENLNTGVGTIYISKIPVSFQEYLRLEGNTGTALAVVGALVDFSNCRTDFFSNVGSKGGAISLLGDSWLLVNNGTSMNFTNNYAEVHGGAVYNRYIAREDMRYYTDCFIHHEHIFLGPNEWNASFYFDGNRASQRGDAIYSTSVFPCVFGGNISDVFRWRGWNYENVENSLTLINSDAGTITIDITKRLKIFAGEIFNLPLTVVDDLGHNATEGTVFTATSSNESVAQVDPSFTYVSGEAMQINGKENKRFELILHTIGDRIWHIKLPIEMKDCPPGFVLDEKETGVGKCICSGTFGTRLKCDQEHFQSFLQNAFWIGFSPDHKDTLTVSLCLPEFCYRDPNEQFIMLPNSSAELDTFMCGKKHRTGVLCGECKPGYGPAVNSKTYECVHCNDTNIAAHATYYILSLYVPLFVLFLIIIVFNVKLTTGPANAFILYSQVISSTFDLNADGHIPIYLISHQTNSFLVAYRFVYGIFNLDFLEGFLLPFCLGTSLNALDVLQLDYVVAFFPLMMIVLVIGLIKVKDYLTFRWFKKLRLPRNFNIGSSLTHAFTAFLLLSNTKFSLASSYILNIHQLLGHDGEQVGGRRVYFAGQYSADEPVYLFRYYIPAIVLFLIFAVLPPILLLDFPLRLAEAAVSRVGCLRRFYPSLKMKIILDSFQGCYKKDFRFFAGAYFLFRLAINVSYILTDTWLQQFTVQQILCVLLILLVALCRPYKEDKNYLNYVDLLIFTNLTVLNLLSLFLYAFAQINPGQPLPIAAFAMQGLLIFLPLVYMLAYLLWLATRRYHAAIKSFVIWEQLTKLWTYCQKKLSPDTNDVALTDYYLWEDSVLSSLEASWHHSPTRSVVGIDARDLQTDLMLKRAEDPNMYKRASESAAEDEGDGASGSNEKEEGGGRWETDSRDKQQRTTDSESTEVCDRTWDSGTTDESY